jgi:hypothetical protein
MNNTIGIYVKVIVGVVAEGKTNSILGVAVVVSFVVQRVTITCL